MAEILTTTRTPSGKPLFGVWGRVKRETAIARTREFLEAQRADAEAALAEIDEWTVESHRGRERVRSYEEMFGES